MENALKIHFILKSVKLMFVGLLLLLCSRESAASDQHSDIKKTLAYWMAQYNIPGAVLSYAIGDQPIKTVALGCASLSPRVSMTSQNLFLVGSISKSFIAVMILKLTENKILFLDETLEQVAQMYSGKIRSLVEQYPDLKPMTVRELLNHTSGVPQSINTLIFQEKFIQNPHKYYTPEELIQIAMQHSIYFPPGEKGKWSYTNTDYTLLGLIVEDVTHKSLKKNFLSVFSRLSAPSASLYFADKGLIPGPAKNNVVAGYIATDAKTNNIQAFVHNLTVVIPGAQKKTAYQLQNSYNIFSPAASGVIASAPALVAWYRSVFEGDFLSPQSLREMLNTVPNGQYNNARYGLGVSEHSYPRMGKIISHDGLEPGYSTIVMFFPKYKLIVVLATNSSNDKVSTFDVHSGAIIPGLMTHILPYLVQDASNA